LKIIQIQNSFMLQYLYEDFLKGPY